MKRTSYTERRMNAVAISFTSGFSVNAASFMLTVRVLIWHVTLPLAAAMALLV